MAGRLIWAALLGAITIGPGCTTPPVDGTVDPTPPSGVLPKDSFVLVLAEVQLVEGVSQLRTYRNDNERQRLAEAYNDVWARTGVSAARFERSHAWWWGQPAAMKSVLRNVVDRLKDMEAELNHNDTTVSGQSAKFRPPSPDQASPKGGDQLPH